MISDPRQFLRELLDVAIAAVQPSRCLVAALPPPPKGRALVVGGGKGAAAMAAAVEAAWPGRCHGLVVVRDGYGKPTRDIAVVEAGHPVPDARGVKAAGDVMALVRSATADDLVLCLISGGASAALVLPRDGVSLAEKQSITKHLLTSGAPIHEINTVRKHLSAIKGGQLAVAAAPAEVLGLIVSDVVGDDLATIGSGPTVADPTTVKDAIDVLARHKVQISDHVRLGLQSEAWETPKSLPTRVANTIIARPRDALDAAKNWVEHRGMACIDLGDRFDRESAVIAHQHIPAIAAAAQRTQPTVILSGGEATVVVKGTGTGGPNTEFALGLALALEQAGLDQVWCLAADTDGTDGVGGHAGAIIDPDMLVRCRRAGLDPARALASNDTASMLSRSGHLLVTGPTFTNVNDFRAILVLPRD